MYAYIYIYANIAIHCIQSTYSFCLYSRPIQYIQQNVCERRQGTEGITITLAYIGIVLLVYKMGQYGLAVVEPTVKARSFYTCVFFFLKYIYRHSLSLAVIDISQQKSIQQFFISFSTIEFIFLQQLNCFIQFLFKKIDAPFKLCAVYVYYRPRKSSARRVVLNWLFLRHFRYW